MSIVTCLSIFYWFVGISHNSFTPNYIAPVSPVNMVNGNTPSGDYSNDFFDKMSQGPDSSSDYSRSKYG